MADLTRRLRDRVKPGLKLDIAQPGDSGGGGERERFGPGVGATLRQARQARGETIDAIAAVLRIRAGHLEAIEEGRFDALPGPTYAAGFIRSYASYLGLNPESVVEQFRDEDPLRDNRTELNFPVPAPEGRVPGAAILLVSVVLAVLVYAAWYFQPARDHASVEPVAQPPQETAADAQSGSGPAGSSESSAGPPSDGGPTGMTTTGAVKTGVTSAPAETSVAAKSAELAAQRAQGQTSGQTSGAVPSGIAAAPGARSETPHPESVGDAPHAAGGSRIALRANGEAWVQIRDADDNLIVMRVLRPGETYEVPNRPGLTLLTGNAGALDVLVDGKSAPSLGQAGVVRKDVKLDPDRLLAGTAVHD